MLKENGLTYKNCKISYAIYGENEKYSAVAHITIQYGNNHIKKTLALSSSHNSAELAESAIIEKSKEWADCHSSE